MQPQPNVPSQGQPSLGKAALDGLCPRCGQRTLFDSWVRFAPACRACGLDYDQFNVGDGPAAFLTLIIGAVATILALIVEFSFDPPFWLHILLWPPIVILGTLASLRVAKAMLLIIEHRRRAAQGQLERSILPDPEA